MRRPNDTCPSQAGNAHYTLRDLAVGNRPSIQTLCNARRGYAEATMPFMLFVVYPCVLWSAWYESVTGRPPQFIKQD